MKKPLVASILVGVLVVLGLPIGPTPLRAQGEKPVPIGMAKTFFADLPPVIISLVKAPFADLMKTATGLKGELHTDCDAFTLADQLDKGTMQLGVFHGHELAWVRKKHPDIKPLLLAINKYRDVSSYVIVHKDCTAKGIADLRGKKIDLPLGTKQQCRVFLEHHCADNNQSDWRKFFGAALHSQSIVAALDDVARKQTDAVVVDHIAFELYKYERGPVYENKLRVLAKSEQFPPVAIAYKEGAIQPDVLKKINDGLRKANEFEGGKDLMLLWQIEAFESVPPSFEKMLTDTNKRYPSPAR
ncbi:MAG: hypothetical protein EXS16_17055 [Gemmataceae bacterium]|nr:hypothetical protein [Gemmataceae bacterium]